MMWRIPEAMCTVVDTDTTWVLPVSTGRIHALDPVAETIWSAMDGAASTSEVLERLVSSTGWNREEIAPHVEALVAQLISYGLVEKVPAP